MGADFPWKVVTANANFRDSILIFYRFRNFSLEFFLSSDAIRSFLSIVFEQLFLQ